MGTASGDGDGVPFDARWSGFGIERPRLFRALVGRSAGIVCVREELARAAATAEPVLLLGEIGAGQEVVARNIHYHSSRRPQSFVPGYFGAAPDGPVTGDQPGPGDLLDGMRVDCQSLIERARGGTLYVNELGNLPLDAQDRLVAACLPGQHAQAGGGLEGRPAVRLVAASHRDLRVLLAQGVLRRALYDAFCGNTIYVPALRERKADIPLLVSELNARFRSGGRAVARFGPAAVELLARYDWPGNLDELANVVERCAMRAPGCEAAPEDLPVAIERRGGPTDKTSETERSAAGAQDVDTSAAETIDLTDMAAGLGADIPPTGVDLKSVLETLEVRLIRQALDDTDWVVTRSAVLLGLRRTTLVEKLRKYGIRRADRR